MDKIQDIHSSAIATFFAGKSVLITGGTGFLGKVLIVKLLESCPDLSSIYILVRPRKGLSPDERIQRLVQDNPIFEHLRHDRPESLEKVKAIHGDFRAEDLGLSEEDRATLVESIHVIFNSAATVRFDEDLQVAIDINVKGPMAVAALAKKMHHLESFVHVSTAYSQCNLRRIEEKIYLDERFGLKKVLEDATTKSVGEILGDFPNTYTFTKAMAEQELITKKGDLPLVLLRPSIVSAARKEPLPGWVDNFNAATGFMAAYGSGLLRSIRADVNTKIDLIPVDTVINMMCAVAFFIGTQKKRLGYAPVFHCTSGHVTPLTWAKMRKIGNSKTKKYPFEKMVWIPGGTPKKYDLSHQIHEALFMRLPVWFYDSIRFALGKKPILTPVLRRLLHGMSVLQFFMENSFNWEYENGLRLWESLSETDKQLFNFNVADLDWEQYLESYQLGIRRYALKEPDSSLESCRKRYEMLEKVQLAFQLLGYFILVALVYTTLFS